MWVEDKDSVWIAAEVVDFVGKQVQVVTSSGKKVIFSPNFHLIVEFLLEGGDSSVLFFVCSRLIGVCNFRVYTGMRVDFW